MNGTEIYTKNFEMQNLFGKFLGKFAFQDPTGTTGNLAMELGRVHQAIKSENDQNGNFIGMKKKFQVESFQVGWPLSR